MKLKSRNFKRWGLFPADIHASLLVLPGSEKAIKTTVTSGQRCLRLPRLSGQIGLFAKMFMVTSTWASTKCLLTWKMKRTPAKRLLFQLVPWTPRIEEIESGLLPTPVTHDANNPRKPHQILERVEGKAGYGVELKDYVQMWPTPLASGPRSSGAILQMRKLVEAGATTKEEAEAMIGGSLNPKRMNLWPTPRAFMHKDSKTDRGKSNLGEVVGGNLNPQFVEWLMGYPQDWTKID